MCWLWALIVSGGYRVGFLAWLALRLQRLGVWDEGNWQQQLSLDVDCAHARYPPLYRLGCVGFVSCNVFYNRRLESWSAEFNSRSILPNEKFFGA